MVAKATRSAACSALTPGKISRESGPELLTYANGEAEKWLHYCRA
jgi:hypothetical protein